MRLAPWAAAVVLLAACETTRTETPQQLAARLRDESDSARVAIEASDARFMRFVGAGQADSLASIYAEDAVFHAAGQQPVQGRSAIVEHFRSMLAAGTWTMQVMVARVEASGPVAVETGRNLISYTPGPNAPPEMSTALADTVAYVTTWRKIDGKWMAVADIGVSTKAPPPAVPARRR